MPKVWNKRNKYPPDAVYVGRPSKWGNPYAIGRDGPREQVIQLYREWIDNMILLGKRDVSELRGKNLVCWCAPLPCHADVLFELANKL